MYKYTHTAKNSHFFLVHCRRYIFYCHLVDIAVYLQASSSPRCYFCYCCEVLCRVCSSVNVSLSLCAVVSSADCRTWLALGHSRLISDTLHTSIKQSVKFSASVCCFFLNLTFFLLTLYIIFLLVKARRQNFWCCFCMGNFYQI